MASHYIPHTILHTEHLRSFVEHSADELEKHFEDRFENSSFSALTLTGEPAYNIWYKVPVPCGLSADGSGYHIYLRKGTGKNLCIILSGGGMAWNDYTASRPITAGKMMSNQPGYYNQNLRPSTEVSNIGGGITNTSKENNPFKDWSFALISYATGDFHIGDHDYSYCDKEGNQKILHFHGRINYIESMKIIRQYFPYCEKLLFAGDSAGGFAVSALAGEMVEKWYPDCQNIYILSDAAMLIQSNWKNTVRNIWHAEPSFYADLQTDNITLDWYRSFLNRYKGRARCLYSGSIHDYLLTAYYNDLEKKEFTTDHKTQQFYQAKLSHMVSALQEADPAFGFFIHNMHMPMSSGTVHTTLRRSWFYLPAYRGHTICDWLYRCVNQDVENIGLPLLSRQ